MFQTGLLILTQPLAAIRRNFKKILSNVTQIVSSTLYVHIQPITPPKTNIVNGLFQISKLPASRELQKLVSTLYFESASLCNGLDIRILLGHMTNSSKLFTKYTFKSGYQVVLFDHDGWEPWTKNSRSALIDSLMTDFPTREEPKFEVIKTDDILENTGDLSSCPSLLETYNNVVLGGTFDRLHIGHKLLLSEACLLTDQRLVVGVTDESMHSKKVLHELIESTDERKRKVQDFLESVKPGLVYDVVAIDDVYGPTAYDPSLQCVVLSQETIKGGAFIRDLRKTKGLTELKEYVIEIIDDACHSQFEEEKISSSSLRKRSLGTLINPVNPRPHLPSRPYLIGLCGGIASGKSAICRRLEGLGAGTINCDKLAHEVYLKGSQGFSQIVEEFGDDILGTDGEIDRRKLGPVVFSDKEKLQKLNRIVWPEVERLAQQKAQNLYKEGKDVVILEAALLLEAGWAEKLHEVWSVVVTEEEAIRRIMERNQLSREESSKRVHNQMSSWKRALMSNVVLCALWEYEYTQQQVEKAWALLRKRMG